MSLTVSFDSFFSWFGVKNAWAQTVTPPPGPATTGTTSSTEENEEELYRQQAYKDAFMCSFVDGTIPALP